MIKLLPLLLLIIAGLAIFRYNVWRMGRSLRRQSRPLHHDQLDQILGQLASAAGIDDIKVRLLDNPMPNGMATPEGEIYLTRGLFRHFQSGKISVHELGSVVAHELGHLALGHTRRRIIDMAGAQTAQIVLGGILARFVGILGWYASQFLVSLFIARISRGDEFEADAYATALMMRAGLGAEPQAQMLEKLEQILPHNLLAQQTSWLASHPPVADRTAAIRANAARWGGRLHA
ncbi:M48 family metalloprotease [Limibaculum sp. M0105]|uniref:M48 family metalloprotease n=1 Tax=Thermohalobaculum xanthum TaxID=2753746 RepID=A0A8J7M3T3_9RHOB|nr:M48 family metalloprotease [Thermohalobaculum xanthum]MBK0397623.1 M48 family metalloprotease [Thermohalobaculum xanthum]